MVDYIADDGPPPSELKIAWQCERWHTLPDAGGLLDQDYRLLTRMGALLNVYNAVTHLKRAEGKQIHTLSDSERRILRVLVDMGLIFN